MGGHFSTHPLLFISQLFSPLLSSVHGRSHLSKRPSDLKQNGTQEKTPFSDTVFHTLSHGVFHFVAGGSFKNH